MRILISMMSLSLTVSVASTAPSLAAEKSYLALFTTSMNAST